MNITTDNMMEITKMRDGNPLLHKQLSIYLGVPISILGLIGNFFCVLVWRRINQSRDETLRSAGLHLILLTIVNSLLLLCFLTHETLPEIWRVLENNVHFVQYYCYVGYPMFQLTVVASIWMVVGVVLNRFVAVVYPEKAGTYNSQRATKVIISLTWLFSIVVSLPYFFTQRPRLIHGNAEIATTEFGKSGQAHLYEVWGHSIVLVITPWLIICVVSGLIVRNIIYKTRIQKHKKSGNRQMEHQMTVTVLVLSIVFLVLLLWQLVTECFWMFGFGMGDKKTWFNVSSAYAPARLGVVVNAAIGFIVYCVSSSVFRKELRSLFTFGSSTTREYRQFANTNSTYLQKKKVFISDYDAFVEADKDEEKDEEEEEEEGGDQGPIHAVA